MPIIPYREIPNQIQLLTGSHWHPSIDSREEYCIKVFWIGTAGGTALEETFFLPDGYTAPIADVFGSSSSYATLRLFVARMTDYKRDTLNARFSFENGQSLAGWKVGILERYSRVALTYTNGIDTSTLLVHFPEISSGTTFLWVDTLGKTYYDNDYATLACGKLGSLSVSDSLDLLDNSPHTDWAALADQLSISDKLKFSPRRMANEILAVSDEIAIISSRHATITDWNFTPSYKLLYDDGNGWATTSWTLRIDSYSSIKRSLKHWTGDLVVGNWGPSFVDHDNELWGSLYGNGSEARGKSIKLRAMISSAPLTYVSQFTGNIQQTKWRDARVSFDIKDKLKDLPNKKFIWDYQNLGSSNGLKTWGIVTRIVGTDVMFDDYGDMAWIERKVKGRSVFQTLISGVIGGVVGFVSGGPVGAGVGFFTGVAANPPESDKLMGAYWQVQDYDAIPDDLVRSGQKVKFHPGSLSGIATNSSGELFSLPEKTITGGTFTYGIHGTLSFSANDISGISIGDYIYVRRPIVLAGGPNEILTALLTGSNVDSPYKVGGERIVYPKTPGGVCTFISEPSDFASDWSSELSIVNLFEVSKIITEETSPFEELKELVKELQISFFLDEDDKFSARSVRPRGINATNVATYSEGKNILDGFSFTRGLEDAKAGFRIFYDHQGNIESTPYSGGFTKKLEVSYSAIPGVSEWTEVQSKWIRRDEDAQIIAWRARCSEEDGVDKVELPTTLYGAIHNVGDLIRITHRMGSLTSKLFEIESYDKDFGESRVNLEAIDAERLQGRGVGKWSGTAGAYDAGLSGYSYSGLSSGTMEENAGSTSGTLLSWGTEVGINNPTIWTKHIGKYFCIGSNINSYTEIVKLTNVANGTLQLARAQVHTLSRTYFPNEILYELGQSLDLAAYRFATTTTIPSTIGTSFRFF